MPYPAASPLGHRASRIPAWLWTAIVLSAAHVVFDVMEPASRMPGRKLVDYVFLEYLCILVIWAFARASRRPDFPPDLRQSLRWAAAAALLQALGGCVLIVRLLITILVADGASWGDSLRYVANILFLMSFSSMVVGLVRMPRAQSVFRGPARSAVDALTFLVGAGVPFWLFSLRPILTGAFNAHNLFEVLFPVASFSGLLTLSWAMETRAAIPSRGAVRFLLIGSALLWLAEIVLSIGTVSGLERTILSDVINIINGLAFCFWLAAGWRYCVDPFEHREMRPIVAFSPLPLITIVVEVGFLVLLVALREPERQVYPKLLTSLFLFLCILLARETFVIRDSLRLAAARALHKSQARFEALIRHSSDVVLIVSDERIVRFASFAVQDVLGVAPETLVGRDLLDFIHPQDRPEGTAFFDKLVLNPLTTSTIHWRFAASVTLVRYLETAGSNRLNEPDIEGLVLNTRDVTERRHLEEQLHRSARMEAVGRLAGGVAHDFNNLLSVVLTNSELAIAQLDGGGTVHSDPVRKDLDEIRRAAERGATLTNRLLAFSRTEILKPRAVPVADLLRDAHLMLERTLGPAVNVATEFERDCGSLKVNPDDFVQALINLGNNARDAMPDGGTLTLTAASAAVRDRLPGSYLDIAPGRYVCVSVADTGVGMDEATRMRAFEPFFTTKERSKGTGLGLASVYAMVKTAKGGITMTTGLGAGTTIRLWLPEASAELEEIKSEGPRASGSEGATVLVVEDEAPLRHAMERILTAAGHRVFSAGNAADGEAIFDAQMDSIDLVLADIIMPEKSGTKMAAGFRAKKPSQKVLFVSGFTGEQLGAKGLGEGGLLLLRKPYNSDQLLSAVRSVIEDRSLPT